MDTFFVSSFGLFVMGLWHGLCTAPSWPRFLLLANGWVLASEQHTSTPSCGEPVRPVSNPFPVSLPFWGDLSTRPAANSGLVSCPRRPKGSLQGPAYGA